MTRRPEWAARSCAGKPQEDLGAEAGSAGRPPVSFPVMNHLSARPRRLTGQWTRRAAARDAESGERRICRMVFEELCVLANGDLVCSCADPSGRRVYGNVHRDRIADVWDGPRYRGMRRAQLAARASSWCPVIGTDCAGRVSAPTPFDRESGQTVRMLQLEPISHCNLACPACPVTVFDTDPAYRPDRVATMPLETMLDVVDQLPDLEKILFYNFGEPFLHPRALDFLREVRRRRPEVALHTSTNGLALTPAKIEAIAAERLLDRVVVSIDGAREASYRRYRVGGRLDRALAALGGLAEARDRHGADGMEIVWQYILFRWNDSDEELAEAQGLADRIGVPLSFIATHTEGASTRFRDDGSGRLERLLGASDPWGALTCDLRRENLERGGGAAGLVPARLRLVAAPAPVAPGGRFAARVEIELADRSIERIDGRLRLGVRLESERGRTLRELPGIPLSPGDAPTSGSIVCLVDGIAPDEPGRYRLLVDLVREGVTWFHERGGTPLRLPLEVSEAAIAFSSRGLVSDLLETALGHPADEAAIAHFTEALDRGAPTEAMLLDVVAERGTDDPTVVHRLREAAWRGTAALVERGAAPVLQSPAGSGSGSGSGFFLPTSAAPPTPRR